jgi:hypothetical protein
MGGRAAGRPEKAATGGGGGRGGDRVGARRGDGVRAERGARLLFTMPPAAAAAATRQWRGEGRARRAHAWAGVGGAHLSGYMQFSGRRARRAGEGGERGGGGKPV